MSVTVTSYSETEFEQWDAFVSSSRNGTVFHMRKFLRYHPADRFEDCSLLFFENGVLRAVLPGAIQRKDGKKHFVSHPGSTFGGMVLSSRGGLSATVSCVEAAVAYFRAQGMSSAKFLRLTPPSLRQQPADDQEYALLQNGFHCSRFELGSMILLEDGDPELLLSTLDISCRNKVRQAMRAGIEVRPSEDLEVFWPILARTLEKRHGVRPTHTLEEMHALLRLCPGEIRFTAAYHEGKLVAGLLLMSVIEGKEYVKYMVQDFAFQKLRPINLLLFHVMQDCIRRGVHVLDLGVSMDESGKRIHPGLFDFKEGFGGRPVRRESYTIEF